MAPPSPLPPSLCWLAPQALKMVEKEEKRSGCNHLQDLTLLAQTHLYHTLLSVLHGDKEWLCHPSRCLQVSMLVRYYGDDPLTTLVDDCGVLDVGVESAGGHRLLRIS